VSLGVSDLTSDLYKAIYFPFQLGCWDVLYKVLCCQHFPLAFFHVLFMSFFFIGNEFLLSYCYCTGVHCDIYKSSYNIS
jgi:hypothetical protein